MRNKMKAWRLAAIVMGPHHGRANKAALTVLGQRIRLTPGLQATLQKAAEKRGNRL